MLGHALTCDGADFFDCLTAFPNSKQLIRPRLAKLWAIVFLERLEAFRIAELFCVHKEMVDCVLHVDGLAAELVQLFYSCPDFAAEVVKFADRRPPLPWLVRVFLDLRGCQLFGVGFRRSMGLLLAHDASPAFTSASGDSLPGKFNGVVIGLAVSSAECDIAAFRKLADLFGTVKYRAIR